jgi:ecotin
MFHFSLLVSLVLFLGNTVQSEENLKAFPPAEAGSDRYVLQLPEVADESLIKVELIVGKKVVVDSVNRYFYGGALKTVNIPGWGFDRFVLENLGPMAGTRIGVDPNEPKSERFVSLGGEPFLIRYNSKLPVVVYVPSGVEVRYRLWRTVADQTAVPKR